MDRLRVEDFADSVPDISSTYIKTEKNDSNYENDAETIGNHVEVVAAIDVGVHPSNGWSRARPI